MGLNTFKSQSFLSQPSRLFVRFLSSASPRLSASNTEAAKEAAIRAETHTQMSDTKLFIPMKTKTVAEVDAELRERLEQISGNGGAAGIEYEDGKPSAMKRGVRENMFRVI